MSYSLTWVTSIIFLSIEKDDEYVRFHARQAIAFGVASIIGWVACLIFVLIFDRLSFVGDIVSDLIWAAFSVGWLILWVLLMVKAYQGERFKLPVLGDMVEEGATG